MAVQAVGLQENAGADSGHTATGSGKDMPNLDVLRAIAVLSVVISHIIEVSHPLVPLYRYGAFGVGMFFIHTSLVLMWSLERRPNTVDFYIRRAFRIYPLSVIAVLLVVLLHAPVGPFRGTQMFVYSAPTWKQIGTHLLLVQNLFGGNSMLYVLWTLALEVQMYLMLPVFFFFLQKNRKLWLLLVFWSIAFLFCVREFSGMDLNLVFASCFFLPGIMAFTIFGRWKQWLPGWAFPLMVLVVGTIGGNAKSWVQAAPAALALGLLLPMFRQLRPSLLTRASWYIARYSYGVYLLHPFCLVLAFHLLPHLAYPTQIAFFCFSVTLLSVAAYHLIEAPGIRLGSQLAARMAR